MGLLHWSLGLSGEFGSALCGGFIGSLISSASLGCSISMLEVSNELSVALSGVLCLPRLSLKLADYCSVSVLVVPEAVVLVLNS